MFLVCYCGSRYSRKERYQLRIVLQRQLLVSLFLVRSPFFSLSVFLFIPINDINFFISQAKNTIKHYKIVIFFIGCLLYKIKFVRVFLVMTGLQPGVKYI